jgi:hypothetical protein
MRKTRTNLLKELLTMTQGEQSVHCLPKGSFISFKESEDKNLTILNYSTNEPSSFDSLSLIKGSGVSLLRLEVLKNSFDEWYVIAISNGYITALTSGGRGKDITHKILKQNTQK